MGEFFNNQITIEEHDLSWWKLNEYDATRDTPSVHYAHRWPFVYLRLLESNLLPKWRKACSFSLVDWKETTEAKSNLSNHQEANDLILGPKFTVAETDKYLFVTDVLQDEDIILRGTEFNIRCKIPGLTTEQKQKFAEEYAERRVEFRDVFHKLLLERDKLWKIKRINQLSEEAANGDTLG